MSAPAKFRIELQGDGRILNASGNPIDGNEKERLVRMANCHDELIVALRNLLRETSTIEVLGEWEALDINTGLRKTTRARVDAVINTAHCIVSKMEGYK